MKQPTVDGLAVSESLYDFDEYDKTDSKVQSRPEKSNLFGPPSLIPSVEYPISEQEEHLLDLAYDKGYNDAMRMNRAGHLVEDDPFLDILRGRVNQIRKEMIKKGRIEPATPEERRLV